MNQEPQNKNSSDPDSEALRKRAVVEVGTPRAWLPLSFAAWPFRPAVLLLLKYPLCLSHLLSLLSEKLPSCQSSELISEKLEAPQDVLPSEAVCTLGCGNHI